jgi:hypothetical protein
VLRTLTAACLVVALGGCGPSRAAADAAAEALDALAPEAARADAALDGTDGSADSADGGAYADGGPCMPGLPRCHGDFGYQMCQQDGTWGPSSSCAGYSMNGTTSYCAELPVADGGRWGTCVDPACWYWLGRGALGGATPVGICEPDGTIDVCDTGGTLAPAACAGACTTVAMLDGRAVGFCAPACEDGARECLGGPFYRTCTGGRWSATPATCAGACNPVAMGARPDIRCGGACDPDTSRCSADLASVETCGADGTWTIDRACRLGRCRAAGPQAECETECAPGTHACAFDGAPTARACDATGLWMPEAACAEGTTCRLAGDVALGCVACAGSGNAYGAADSNCVAGGVETCGADGTWQATTPCLAGQACVSIGRGASTLAACDTP